MEGRGKRAANLLPRLMPILVLLVCRRGNDRVRTDGLGCNESRFRAYSSAPCQYVGNQRDWHRSVWPHPLLAGSRRTKIRRRSDILVPLLFYTLIFSIPRGYSFTGSQFRLHTPFSREDSCILRIARLPKPR